MRAGWRSGRVAIEAAKVNAQGDAVTDDEFWAVIDAGGARAKADGDRHFAAVRKALLKLPPAQVCDFERHLWERLTELYTKRMWGAGSLVNGGCSDDGFDYFRCWVIGQGRAVYEAAVRDPDTLAGHLDLDDGNEREWEELLVVAGQVYEEQTGGEMPDDGEPGPGYADFSAEDNKWDFGDDAENARRLPRLWAIYGDGNG